MPAHQPTQDNARIAAAALRLAGAKGWDKVTLDAVAKAAKIPLASFKKRFVAPQDLVGLIAEDIDREAFAATDKMSGTRHDRLFDLLMARFDILQKHRPAIISMANCTRHDRALSCALARATLDSAYRLIAAAGLTAPPPRLAIAAGLVSIYGYAFWIWSKDSSRDMTKTMSAVDKGLRWAGKAASFLHRP